MSKYETSSAKYFPETAPFITEAGSADNDYSWTLSTLEALDHITACLRHYQAFGDRQDLDESIFSLIALEARLHRSTSQGRAKVQ
jgi:hypothetical protein